MSLREVISFFYPDSKARLGEIVVDAYLSETHTFSSQVTEHPIETGGAMMDHIHEQAFCLSIEGLISNTPMTLVGLTMYDSNDENYALIAFEKIEKIFHARTPIWIATSLKSYENMVLESLSIERGAAAQDYLRFSCTAKQIRMAKQMIVTVKEPKVNRAKPKENRGLQETKPLSKEQAEGLKSDNSLIFSLGKKLFGG